MRHLALILCLFCLCGMDYLYKVVPEPNPLDGKLVVCWNMQLANVIPHYAVLEIGGRSYVQTFVKDGDCIAVDKGFAVIWKVCWKLRDGGEECRVAAPKAKLANPAKNIFDVGAERYEQRHIDLWNAEHAEKVVGE